MPIDASITGTPLGAITGSVTNADDGTINGTIGYVAIGTLSSSVGVPGPPGVGVPVGGTAGQVLAKVDGVDYNTEWINVDPSTSWGEITGTLSDQTDLQSALNLKAPLASPALTGNPTAPTAALGDNDTSIATTAFVQQELLSGTANAKNLEVYVRNQTGSTLAAGTIVYVNGATGNRPTVTPAQANNDANSAQTMGFVKTSIANNGFGYVIVRGELENINTSALTEGVQLYLSPTTPGAWTTTKPSAPQHMVYVGVVIRAHPTLGVILVSVMNGLELEELHNVQIVTPTNGQVLKYDAATNLWKNQTDSVGAVTSVAGRTGAVVLSNTDISGLGTMATATATDYLSKAGNLAGLANLTTARNNLGLGTSNDVYFNTVQTVSDILVAQGVPGAGIIFGDSSLQSTAFLGYANPAFTGNVTITTNNTLPAFVITQEGTGDIIQFRDQASDTTYSFIDANGKVNTIASATATAGLSLPHGAAPTTPVNGDIWTTTSGLFMRQNGVTRQYVDFDGSQTINGVKTFSNASSTFGSSTATGTIGLATGATISGSTKTVNIGTGGVAGSTTNINIGPTAGTGTATFNALLSTRASATTGAGLRILPGVAPTSPVNGDLWATSTDLQVRLNGVTETVAEQSWVTSQGYITSSALTGYATESWVTTALGSYLTTATAASTYQTQAGMSSYLTTSAAASTYLTQSNAATTYYPLSSNPAGYLTSAPVTSVAGKTGAVTLAVADVSGAAPTDSPTFTGTPSLPTGTTAVTQAAGNNTTAVATTAFVQQEVPAASTTAAGKVELATNAEVIAGTSTTLALVPGHAGFLKADPRLRSLSFFNGSSISGSGVVTTSTPQTFSRQVYLNTLNTGRACFIFGAIGSTNAGFGTSTTKADQVDFSKKVWLSGYAMMGHGGATSWLGDSNTICRITLGGYSSNTTGDMTLRGIGLKKVGGVGSFVTLTVHNGTTLTDVASTVTVPDGGGIHWVIYSDGTGNVTLYINGSQAATTTAGPTSATASGQSAYREQVEAVATPGVRQVMNCNGGWLYIE